MPTEFPCNWMNQKLNLFCTTGLDLHLLSGEWRYKKPSRVIGVSSAAFPLWRTNDRRLLRVESSYQIAVLAQSDTQCLDSHVLQCHILIPTHLFVITQYDTLEIISIHILSALGADGCIVQLGCIVHLGCIVMQLGQHLF